MRNLQCEKSCTTLYVAGDWHTANERPARSPALTLSMWILMTIKILQERNLLHHYFPTAYERLGNCAVKDFVKCEKRLTEISDGKSVITWTFSLRLTTHVDISADLCVSDLKPPELFECVDVVTVVKKIEREFLEYSVRALAAV